MLDPAGAAGGLTRSGAPAPPQVKDIMNGGYDSSTSIVIVSHGLSIRILLMNWFQWTVDECNAVWNPPNAHPLVRWYPVHQQM